MSGGFRGELRTRVLLVAGFVVSALIFGLGYQLRSRTSRDTPDSYDSFAPTGYRALTELLSAEGWSVSADIVGFADPQRADTSTQSFAFLAPRLSDALPESHRERMSAVLNVPEVRAIVVLPRWEVTLTEENRQEQRWVLGANELSTESSLSVLKGSWLEGAVKLDYAWDDYAFANHLVASTIADVDVRHHADSNQLAQLYEGPEGQRVVVVSDPSPLTNEGLASPGAGALVLDIFRMLDTNHIVIDESQHNRARTLSVEEVLLHRPYLWITLCAGVLLFFFYWNQTARVSRRKRVADERQSRAHALRGLARFLSRSRDHEGAVVAARSRLIAAARSCQSVQRALTGAADHEAEKQAGLIESGYNEQLTSSGHGIVGNPDFVSQARFFSERLRELDHGRHRTTPTNSIG